MGIAKKREAIERDGKKLTGRELFLQDKTLNESDLKFLDDGIYVQNCRRCLFLCVALAGQAVKVDESLFQDLDDLGLDDEEDEDYVYGEDFSDSADSS